MPCVCAAFLAATQARAPHVTAAGAVTGTGAGTGRRPRAARGRERYRAASRRSSVGVTVRSLGSFGERGGVDLGAPGLVLPGEREEEANATCSALRP